MEKVKIHKAGSLPTNQATEISFTGEVLISNYFECENPSKLIVASVTFKPGSRTPWKINPFGQTLIIINGIGWAQCEDVVEIRSGHIVQFPEGKKHWDGATFNHTLSYIALHESKNANAVQFLEKVPNEEYSKGQTLLNQNPNE
ncbi:quercetin dioxygenase-like cupin family protein [Pedobacter psychrotolerans]|uniref:Cupin n=1 Tax=Pedobacter psychrotolerans TaxID=1843235 RepID=A0A4R2HHS0_9SPHI|nr:cupin domain-containing protein [Pedobacter psychrotolerans]TCO28784.1 quercetin dioxygenase-like cupin family protein [Pedobacter psychrotolerans]GGE51681.1 cupin [Pedobacter psychrotolerans]